MRIAIANEQTLTIDILRRIILSVPGYAVAWVARNGREAVAQCAADPPDLILMDLIMPVMDGVEATQQIMQDTPCPVLLITSTTPEKADMVFEAMGYGALDVISTPKATDDAQAQRSREVFLKKIKMIKKLGRLPAQINGEAAITPEQRPTSVAPLVIIGASAGGPRAIAKVLSGLPRDFRGAIVIIQHVDGEFSENLAQWLDAQIPLKVQLAKAGGLPKAGHIYLAGEKDHLIFSPRMRFAYISEPGNSHYRPSIDVFFKSVADHWPAASVAILLTGMGRDGAQGLATLRRLGWHAIVQDEATSVVYGMPRAAVQLGAADKVLPLQDIAPAIMRFFGKDKGAMKREQ